MGKYIVKLTSGNPPQEFYLEWSTIVDAPVTAGMSLAEFRQYYREEYGRNGYRDLDYRLERVEQYGTSAAGTRETPETIVIANRAGPNESKLTMDEIIAAYCLRQPIRDGWTPFDPEAQ